MYTVLFKELSGGDYNWQYKIHMSTFYMPIINKAITSCIFLKEVVCTSLLFLIHYSLQEPIFQQTNNENP